VQAVTGPAVAPGPQLLRPVSALVEPSLLNLALAAAILNPNMALLPILRYPDPRLHTVARPVAEVNDRIRQLVDDMIQTMYVAEGVGLAATQVDVHERVVVMDTSEEHDKPVVLINPEIVQRSAEMALNEEGCLSVPQTYDRVERHARVTVRALEQARRERLSWKPKAWPPCACSTRWTT
jgi:peptide deformylase